MSWTVSVALLVALGLGYGLGRALAAARQTRTATQEGYPSEVLERLKKLAEQTSSLESFRTDVRTLVRVLKEEKRDNVALAIALSSQQQNSSTNEELSHSLQSLVGRLAEQNESLVHSFAPLAGQSQLSEVFASLVSQGNGRGFQGLMNGLVEQGQDRVLAALLSDESGLPLAASDSCRNADAMSAMSAMVLVLVDRFPKGGSSQPQAIVMHMETSEMIVHRLFVAGERRYVFTATLGDQSLTPAVFDPIIGKLQRSLSPVSPA